MITIQEKEAVMPGGDRTGPAGEGPMTGRGAGFCSGSEVAGFENPVMRGRGGGMGRRRAAGRGMQAGRGQGRRLAGRVERGRGRQGNRGGGEYLAGPGDIALDIGMLERKRIRLESELAGVKKRLKSAGGQTGE